MLAQRQVAFAIALVLCPLAVRAEPPDERGVKDARNAGGDLSRSFFQELKPTERSMRIALGLEGYRTVNDLTKVRADLATIDAACRERYASLATQDPAGRPSPIKNPRVWCETADKAEDTLRELALAGSRKTVASIAASRRAVAARLAADKGWGHVPLTAVWGDPHIDESSGVAELRARTEELARTAGTTVPEDFFAELATTTTELWDAMARVAADLTHTPFDGHHARAEALAKHEVEAAGARVVASGLGASDFTVTKTPSGVPIQRTLAVHVVARRGDEPWCREAVFQYTETWQGKSYGQPTANLIDTRFVSCP